MPPMMFGSDSMDLWAIATTIFWVVMLIDCFRNGRLGSSKIFWLLLIFFTHIFGALIYFFAACTFSPMSHASRRRQHYQQYTPPMRQPVEQYRPSETYTPPMAPLPTYDPAYRGYDEGYQAHETPASPYPNQTSNSVQEQYELPQATYPEMPPQQQ